MSPALQSEQNSLTKSHQGIQPRPLFDSVESLKGPQTEYRAARPQLSEYLAQFPSTIAVESDLEFARGFLLSYSGSPSTFKGYRSYIERLILWSWIVQKKSVTDLVRSDAEQFMAFNNAPPASWVGGTVVRRYLKNKGHLVFNKMWRPYGIKIAKALRKHAEEQDISLAGAKCQPARASKVLMFSVCSSFYDFLAQEGMDIANPIKSIKQKSAFVSETRIKRKGKSLTKMQWDFIIDQAEAMADADPKHERTLFIVVALFAMYLRVSDLAGNKDWYPTMGCFVKSGDSWWFEVVGKGNKERDISVKDAFLPYLKRYRQSRNLSPLPFKDEEEPLLVTKGGRKGLRARQIRNIVQPVFDGARAKMIASGHTEEEAQELMEATLHWLRHTGATFDAPYRDAKHMQDDLGHASLATTQDIYYNSINEERAASNRGGIRR